MASVESGLGMKRMLTPSLRVRMNDPWHLDLRERLTLEDYEKPSVTERYEYRTS